MNGIRPPSMLRSLDEPMLGGLNSFFAEMPFNAAPHLWPTDFDDLAACVTVYEYAGPDQFTFEYRTDELEDRLIIAKMSHGPTMRATIARIWKRVDGRPPLFYTLTRRSRLWRGDIIQIPSVHAGISAYSDPSQSINFRLCTGGLLNGPILHGSWGRRFTCDDGFAVLILARDRPTLRFAGWIPDPKALMGH